MTLMIHAAALVLNIPSQVVRASEVSTGNEALHLHDSTLHSLFSPLEICQLTSPTLLKGWSCCRWAALSIVQSLSVPSSLFVGSLMPLAAFVQCLQTSTNLQWSSCEMKSTVIAFRSQPLFEPFLAIHRA